MNEMIKEIPGKANDIADALSRGLIGPDEGRPVPTVNMVTMGPVRSDAEKQEIIARAHEDVGHGYPEVTYEFLKETTQWVGIKKTVQEFVNACRVCREFGEGAAKATIQRVPLACSLSNGRASTLLDPCRVQMADIGT